MSKIPDHQRRNMWLPIGLLTVLLATPGSPLMHFDGLPLRGRLEVLGLAGLFIVGVAIRRHGVVARVLGREERRSVHLLFLAVLIFLKLFTFLRFPLGDNFEVCLKGLYRPTVDRCEKSFDYLFHSNDGANALGDITRVDREVNYRTTTGVPESLLGASHSTWNLPFQNEYPRFSELWQDRLPFTAQIGGVFSAPRDSLLPVELVGDAVISTSGGVLTASENESRNLLILPIAHGRQELRINFSFADSETLDVPDEMPERKGPYAHLVVGSPFSPSDSYPLKLAIRGHVINLADKSTLERVEIRFDNRVFIADPESRPDIAESFEDIRHTGAGFRVQIPLTKPLSEFQPVTLTAKMSSGAEWNLGKINISNLSKFPVVPVATLTPKDSVLVDVRANLMFGEQPPLLRAENRILPSGLSKLLLFSIDLLQAVFFLGLTVLQLTRSAIGHASRIVRLTPTLASGAALVFYALNPSLIPRLPVVPSLFALVVAVVIATISIRREPPSIGSTLAIGYAAVISFVFGIDGFRRLTPLGDHDWWGHMIFRSRDSDWFVFQGYAYQILSQQSLKAGEGVFYFMPGARYVVFLTHVIFGNNDVLIGVLVLGFLIYAGIRTATTLTARSGQAVSDRLIPIIYCSVLMLVVMSSLTMELAISSASETFAWTILLLSVAAITRLDSDLKAHLFGLAVGFIIFLRPNYLAVSVGLVSVVACLIVGSSFLTRLQRSARLLWLMFGFAITSLLPLMHNIYYAETVNFFTDTTDPRQIVFEPIRLLSFFNDPFVREESARKLSQYLYWRSPSPSGSLLASWLAQGLFLFAVYRLVRERQHVIIRLTLLLTPVAYIITSIPFGIMTIPERQYYLGTLTLAISAVLAIYPPKIPASHITWDSRDSQPVTH